MKKCCMILLCALLLCGCGAEETFETVSDEYAQSVMKEERSIQLTVEDGATVLKGTTGTMYLCDGYEVTEEVMSSGNLGGTLKTLTGYETDDLTVIETASSDMKRYECAWAAAGEGGDVVGRAVVMDDGVYHYCVTVLAAAEDAPSLLPVWNAILNSITLV